MKYLISVDKNGQQDISDGAPFDGYYGYDYDERTVDGIVVACTKKVTMCIIQFLSLILIMIL